MTMKHDKGLLKAEKLNAFRQWLQASGFECRDGKGEFEVLQVKVAPKLWAVVNKAGNGQLTTHPELRALINRFNQSAAPLGPAAQSQRDQDAQVQAGHQQFLDDLRDDFAMAAMRGFITRRDPCLLDERIAIARESYDMADAMLAERAKWVA